MKTPIKLAVFDMAGTTINNNAVVPQLLLKAFLSNGFDQLNLDLVDEKTGYAIPEAIRQILSAHPTYYKAFSQAVAEKIYETFKQEIEHHYEAKPDISQIEDAMEVFEALQQLGIKIGLNTNLDRATANLLLKGVGWENHPLIDITVCSDEVAKGRPYPDMILRMMASLGIGSPTEIIKIGDTMVDILEGQQSGCMMSIGITSPRYNYDKLMRANPTHIVSALYEIIPLVTSVFTKIPEENK
ncbi:MAG: HAD-IA family hydrolase [Cytophagales bacterium]|nr:HAD-IA family hydrolase [Cytophagales bacterium]